MAPLAPIPNHVSSPQPPTPPIPIHFPFAEFTGAPYDLGLQHGQRFRDLVRLQLAETMQGAADSGLTTAAALEWTRQQQPAVETIAPHWLDELQGLAHGAGIQFDEALALQLRPGTGGLPEGCTSFAAVGSATTDGRTICGQNRDLGEPYLHRMFLAAFRPTRGPHILMHCVPGEIGGVGLNSHGVCVFANSLWGKSGRTWMAPPILRRAALESATAEAVVDRIQAMPGPAVGNFLIADTRHARNLEILAEGLHVTPSRRRRLRPRQQLHLVHPPPPRSHPPAPPLFRRPPRLPPNRPPAPRRFN